MKTRRGLTLVEVLLVVVIVGLVVWLVILPLQRRRIEARKIRCGNHLNQLAKALACYEGEHGDNRWCPCPLGRTRNPREYNGAEFLAALYWTGCLPDPGVLLCPSSLDTNHEGRDVGVYGTAPTFGSQSVSYAGPDHRKFVGTALGTGQAIYADLDDFAPGEPVASDDTQGTINHGHRAYGGMNVLFYNGHVDFKSRDELDPRTAVGATAPPGRPRPLLWRLRN